MTTTDQEKLKVGFFITIRDSTGLVEIRPAPVVDFATYQGLQCYLDVFLPYQYPSIKDVVVSVFTMPEHICKSGYGPKQMPKSFRIEYERDQESGEVVPRHVVLATVEVMLGEASITYEAVMSPQKTIKVIRYVNRDNPQEVAASETYATLDLGILDAIATAGEMIVKQFGQERLGTDFFAVQGSNHGE
jgi:hypothetical protein